MKVRGLLMIVVCCVMGLATGATHSYADTFTYDLLNRLTKVFYNNGTATVYTYDQMSNLLSINNTSYFTVSANSGTNGSIAPAAQPVLVGNSANITITPNTGYTAAASGCNGSLNGNNYTTSVISSDCTVDAVFTLNTYTVMPFASANGSISPSIPQNIGHGSTVQFAVMPETGYTAIMGGTCGGMLNGNTYTTGAITADCTVTVTFTFDSPPTGSISINSGALYANATSSTLTLSCSDDISGCSQMRFSNDNTTWSADEAYAMSKTWVIAGGDGAKTVYVKYKDGAGNWSNAYAAYITLDTTPPTAPHGATSLDSWFSRNGNGLNSVSYGNSTFVTVGDSGTIMTSTDGITWTPRTSGTSNNLYGVTYGNSIFIAVGDAGTIMTSTDGITWTPRTSGTSNLLFGVTYGNSIFIAVGDLGTIMTSTDGMTWTPRTLGTANTLYGVTYGNSIFIAVGDAGTIMTSTDGITWTPRTSGTSNFLFGVTYGNSIFIVVGDLGTIMTSTDGITWTGRTSGTTNYLWAITYGNSTFVTVGKTGTILTSVDGAIWTIRTSGSTAYLMGVTCSNSSFVVVGNEGTVLITSPDGVTWTKAGTTNGLYGVTYGKSTFVAVGSGGTVLTSPDGTTWTTRASGATTVLRGVTYGNSIFVAVGTSGKILTSSDGTIWTPRTSGTSNNLYGVTYGNSIFIVVGSGGTVLTSPDGTTWTSRTSGTTNWLYGVTYGNSIFIAVGNAGTVLTSPDGTTWTTRTSGTTNSLRGVTYGNSTFVAVGASGTMLTSSDGMTWISSATDAMNYFNAVTYGGSTFVAAGMNNDTAEGTILTSPDGTVWTPRISGNASYFYGASSVDTTFVVVGGPYGAIMEMGFGPGSGVIINSGAATTNTTEVTLTLACVDDGSGCTNMMITNDFVSSMTYSYSPSQAWTLSDGDGVKTVSVKFQDAAGNWSVEYSGTINFITIYTVTPSAGLHGSISPSSPQPVNNGSTTQFTLTPNAGYTASVGGTCGGILSGSTYTTNAITADCTVTAIFTLNTYTVTASGDANGTIDPSSILVNHGATTTFTITPNAGYHANVSGCNGSLSGNTYTTGAITDVCTVTATFTNSAPGTPTLTAPALSSEVTTTVPTLSVTAQTDPDEDAVSYLFEVYSSPTLTFGSLVTSAMSTSIDWTVDVPLSDNTTYYWRSQATDGYANSNWMGTADFFVNTENDAPTGLGISAPADNTVVATVTPVLSVTNVTDLDNDTVTYGFDVATDSGFLNIVSSVTATPQGTEGNTSFLTGTLLDNTVYYWRAKAVDVHNAESNVVSAAFFVNTANDAPTAPAISSPVNLGETLTIAPVLSVNNSTDADQDSLTYVFELDTVNSFNSGTNYQASGFKTEGSGVTTWTPAALVDNTMYYWRAKANDGQTESAWTTGSFFVNTVNDVPTVPTLNNPADNGEANVLLPVLTLNAATDVDNDNLTYEFMVYSDSGLATLVTSTSGASAIWTVETNLADNTRYWWKARAVDQHGLGGEWMAAASFFVNNNGTNDPSAITVTAPGASEPVTNAASFTIGWTASDPDSDPVITLYYDQTGSGYSGTEIATGIHLADPNSYAWDISGLADGTYYVYATIDDGATVVNAYAEGTVIIDRTAPAALISGTPAALTNATSADLTISGAGVTEYKYTVDGGSQSTATPTSTHVILAGLSNGSHTVSVIGKDAGGNWQGTATTATWTVDAVAPTLTGSASYVDPTHVDVTFNETVNGAALAANYGADSGLLISAVSSQGSNVYRLTTSMQSVNGTYTITASNISDFAANAISITANTATFTRPLSSNVAPATPIISSPASGSETTTETPALLVNTSLDPDGDQVTYTYEVYADSGLATLVAGASGQGPAWTVPAGLLTDNTTYYWRAQATDGTANSNWMATANCFVNTANDAPAEPGISSPANNSSVAAVTPTLSVTNGADADAGDILTYDFDVASDGGFLNIVATVTSAPSGAGGITSWLVSAALVDNTPYYWRARANDNHGAASDWATGSFFVNTLNDAPTAPSLNAPIVNSEVATITPELLVNNGSDPDHDALRYTFELDRVNTFDSADKQTSNLVAEGAGTTGWTTAALSDNTTYYWRARANDGSADSPWMSGSFIVNTANDAPTVPTLSNPSDLGQVTVLSPTLSINAATDVDNDVLTYDYEVYGDSSLTNLAAGTTGAGTSWTLGASLSDNTTYYWRTRAKDEHGLAGAWMNGAGFFVNNSGYNDPPTITVTSPAASIDIADSSTVTIAWTASDPDSDPAITLYYDQTGSGHNGTEIVTGMHKSDPSSSYAWSVSNLPDGVYYVYAKIDDGTTTVYAYATGMLMKAHSGDVSGDGVVDINDALAALRIVAGLSSGNNDEMAQADVAPIVNGVPQPDGKVDIGDVLVILRAAAGLVSW